MKCPADCLRTNVGKWERFFRKIKATFHVLKQASLVELSITLAPIRSNIAHAHSFFSPVTSGSCFCKSAQGRDPFNQNSNRSDREKRTTSKGGPFFPKLFRLDRTDPLSFGPKFPEILVEWIAPQVSCEKHKVGINQVCKGQISTVKWYRK